MKTIFNRRYINLFIVIEIVIFIINLKIVIFAKSLLQSELRSAINRVFIKLIMLMLRIFLYIIYIYFFL